MKVPCRRSRKANQAADSAAASIEIVVDGIGKIAESSRSISEISKDQANAMEQAEQGVNQISEVVQSNSATAEESPLPARNCLHRQSLWMS